MHSKALSVLKLSVCLLAGPGPGRVIRMVDRVVTHCFEHMNICFMDYFCVSPCMFAMGSRWPPAPANDAAVGVVVLVTALVLPVTTVILALGCSAGGCTHANTQSIAVARGCAACTSTARWLCVVGVFLCGWRGCTCGAVST